MTLTANEKDPLLGNSLDLTIGRDSDESDDDGEHRHREFVALKERAWSFGEKRLRVATTATTSPIPSAHKGLSEGRHSEESPFVQNYTYSVRSAAQAQTKTIQEESKTQNAAQHYLFCLIYAVVNVIIAVPALFGYAAVIFNHPIFANHMNVLSKLLISSSLIHQLGFTLFSSLPFAIGTVQDAGLIFLSAMSNSIANRMIEEGHTESEILSTTLALLCLGTALLGLVLVLMGRYKLADAVSFLPMPVVGGYLAYIGYFCILAGTSLCISQPMMDLGDWALLFDKSNLVLAIPGLATGVVLTLISRMATNSGTLPLVMVAIPAAFYVIISLCGVSLEEARESGWVGETSPPVPMSELVHIIDFSIVRWDLIGDIIPTWFGMVFVVSFASCLDVAAISIDMGKPLDTNRYVLNCTLSTFSKCVYFVSHAFFSFFRELATVGICNFMSGITLGFTGSYIFSQTIFTYRTGIHDKCIGIMIMLVYMYIVASPVNILEIVPLFFLGSALIFIGYDLMFEWLWEVRHQVFLSEYFIVFFTFISIHAVGINFGILIGILIAICDQILTTAQSTGVSRIEKRSRAVYTKRDAKIIHEKAYCSYSPKIVTLEVIGNMFFGSSLSILNQIYEEVGILEDDENELSEAVIDEGNTSRIPPWFVVLDLMGVTHLDASAARGCFLQLAKRAAQKQIIVCASGLSPKTEWMFRSHEVAFESATAEEHEKALLLDATKSKRVEKEVERILIFRTAAEALEFCETRLLHDINGISKSRHSSQSLLRKSQEDLLEKKSKDESISSILSKFLGASVAQEEVLERLMDLRYHEEKTFHAEQFIFSKRSNADAFYIVLHGCVGTNSTSSSGAGRASSGTIGTLWQVGGVFGFNDFLLERKRTFQTFAMADATKLAIFTRSGMSTLSMQDPELYGLMQQVLLRASTLDLANCTCHDV